MVDKKKNPKGAGRKRKLTPLQEAACYQSYLHGVSSAEIAFKNGISPSTLQRIIKKYKEVEKKE